MRSCAQEAPAAFRPASIPRCSPSPSCLPAPGSSLLSGLQDRRLPDSQAVSSGFSGVAMPLKERGGLADSALPAGLPRQQLLEFLRMEPRPVCHSQPSLSIRLCPPRGSHWPPSAGRQGPGHPDSAPAGCGAPPTAPPRSGGASWAPLPGASVLLVFGKQTWAGGPAGERSGSGFSPDNAGGLRAQGWGCSWRGSGVFREREAGGTGPGPRGWSRGRRRTASAP